jgi:hypothetical protein
MDIRTLHGRYRASAYAGALRDLASWWSWSPLAPRLFSWIDPEHWRRYHNPVQILINVEPQQWMRLLADPEFRRTYEVVVRAWDEYRSRPRWFDPQMEALGGPVAYFSMEFGIHESLGVYSGGLGVLSEIIKADDLDVLVGVASHRAPQTGRRRFRAHLPRLRRAPILPVQAPGRRLGAYRPARRVAGRGLAGLAPVRCI